MKKLCFIFIFIGLFSGSSSLLLKSASAQETKACSIGMVDGISLKIPIDPKSDFSDNEKFTAIAFKVDSGYTYFVSDKAGATVSQVDLTYFKSKSGIQQVRIKVCGRVQNNPNIPYLNFKFVSGNKIIKVKALGTQSAVYTISKPAHTTTVQTVFKV